MRHEKVGVALSGGVDSTSTALLLKRHYNVTGFFMQLAQPDLQDQTDRVKTIAERLGIPLQIVNLEESFEKRVLDYFSSSYYSGLTPNPCVICNREIKFGLFLESILAAGMDKMATGHYARIEHRDDGFHLLKGIDPSKDQSYFLSRLHQQQLQHVLFPLGTMKKEEMYPLVERHGFDDFRGRESQDVCFLEDTKVGEFLQSRDCEKIIPGDIIKSDGTVLGKHGGIANYTIGQRRGLGISAPRPYYVIRLDGDTNSVVVGEEDELLRRRVELGKLHWITGDNPSGNLRLEVKIRSTHSGCSGVLSTIDDRRWQLDLDEPQRAITPGQFAVFYNGEEVLGSAEIL